MINLNFWEMDLNFCLRRYIQARNRIALRYHNRLFANIPFRYENVGDKKSIKEN